MANKGFNRWMVTLLGDLSANFAQARTAPREVQSCRAIGDKGSVDPIGSAIRLGVGARSRAKSGHTETDFSSEKRTLVVA